jgi:hypothetical protein
MLSILFYGGNARFYIQLLLLLNSRHFGSYRRRFLGRKDLFKVKLAENDQTTTMASKVLNIIFSQIQRHRNKADK